jgi:hypothetical protein
MPFWKNLFRDFIIYEALRQVINEASTMTPGHNTASQNIGDAFMFLELHKDKISLSSQQLVMLRDYMESLSDRDRQRFLSFLSKDNRDLPQQYQDPRIRILIVFMYLMKLNSTNEIDSCLHSWGIFDTPLPSSLKIIDNFVGDVFDALGIDTEATSKALRQDTEDRKKRRKHKKVIREIRHYSGRSGKLLVTKDDRELMRLLEDKNVDFDKLSYNLSNRNECPEFLLKPKQHAFGIWYRKLLHKMWLLP